MSLLSSLLDWFKAHDEILGWLIGASVLMLVISVAAVGWVIIRVPADYFARENPGESQWAHRHPLIRVALIIGKNLLGLILLAAGILMLVLPGQGVLTIVVGRTSARHSGTPSTRRVDGPSPADFEFSQLDSRARRPGAVSRRDAVDLISSRATRRRDRRDEAVSLRRTSRRRTRRASTQSS